MNVGDLSREFCPDCEEVTLHGRGRCIHCGRAQPYAPVRDVVEYIPDNIVRQMRAPNRRREADAGRAKALGVRRLGAALRRVAPA